MMNCLPHLPETVTNASKSWGARPIPARIAATLLVLFFAVLGASAQTVTWTDSFETGVESTPAQCSNWRNFLNELGGKSFVSVTMSGSNDVAGKTLADPVAATELARLLSTRTPGTVEFDGHVWSVTKCTLSVCADEDDPFGVSLSYDDASPCNCSNAYAIRPESRLGDWGGINVIYNCGASSQTMKLEFNSGVSITANGPTALCAGSSVQLTANAAACTGPLTYSWSNGATGPSITVNQPGNYSVTVSGPDGCGGISNTIEVTASDVAVTIDPVDAYCDEPVQLNAHGTSGSGSGSVANQVCVYNAPGGAGVDDCTFTSDVCLEGAVFVGNSSYAANVTFENPVELRFQIYYSAFAPSSTFRFLLNDHELGFYEEIDPTGNCDTEAEGKFPRSVAFAEGAFKQHWIQGGPNELKVDIVTDPAGIYLAGITAEVVTSNETYSWSPIAGLSNASIRNPLASPSVTTPYIVTYTDANGCSATAEVEVKVSCGEDEPPVAVCKELTVAVTEGCAISVDPAAFDGGSTTSAGGPLTFSSSHEGSYPVGETEVVLTVTDSNGLSSSCSTRITVTDGILPVIATPADLIVNNDQGACSAALVLEAPQASDNCAIASVTHDQATNVFPVGETIVTWTATDVHGNKKTATQKIIVKNSDPVINSVQASASAVSTDKPVKLTTSFTDNNATSATIDWGDLSAPQIVDNPSAIFEVSHTYDYVGSYDITVTIKDHCGASDTYRLEDIVVFDGGGSVVGDGWFQSERGFYLENHKASGKAQFHFEAKYKKGSSVPEGKVTFRFKEGKLDFTSTRLEWVMIEGDEATLFATGKMNGSRDYSILISAVDEDYPDPHNDDPGKKPKKPKEPKGPKETKEPKKDPHKKGVDQIRVKIWNASGKVIYDTQAGDPDDATADTDIGGGRIDIKHDKASPGDKIQDKIKDAIESHFGNEATSVYPNPFKDYLNVQFNAWTHEKVVVQLVDLRGKVITSDTYPVSEDGFYMLDIPHDADRGIYILVIKQGRRVENIRLVRK